MAVTVRVADPGDGPAVEQILRASYGPLMGGAYDAALLARVLPVITRANPRLLASGSFYLAEDGGEAVGCGGWTREAPESGEVVPAVAHIRHFGVTAASARRGVGRALYARCEADARAAGITRFECHSSLNGQAFYAAMGFTAVRSIAPEMAGATAFPGMLMQRRI